MADNSDKMIIVNGVEISIKKVKSEDYISLTDMCKAREGEDLIRSWMRSGDTIEFLGLWEQFHNSNFNINAWDNLKREVGLNSFTMTPQKWISATHAIGIFSKAGRYGGGTYAHKDIAFDFAMWLSPLTKLKIISALSKTEKISYHLIFDSLFTKIPIAKHLIALYILCTIHEIVITRLVVLKYLTIEKRLYKRKNHRLNL